MTKIKFYEIIERDIWEGSSIHGTHLEFVDSLVPIETVIEYAKLKYATPQGLTLASEVKNPNEHNRVIDVQIYEREFKETSHEAILAELPKLHIINELYKKIEEVKRS